MITRDQVSLLAKKHQINETTIFREYLQLLFLSKFYSFSESRKVFFKGGTALHLIYKAPRFSEDLDFTVGLEEKRFLTFIERVFQKASQEIDVDFKERKTVTGKRFLLTAHPSVLPYKTFINLDFSFREKVLDPRKSIIETDYPVLFASYVYHLSKEEIFAEKIRAILTREKGRDIYDLWFLLNRGVIINSKLIREKLRYYHLKKIETKKILQKIEQFPEKKFIQDLRPFVPVSERNKLPQFFAYLKDYLEKKVNCGREIGSKAS